MEEKVHAILEILENRYPESMCALHYDKDYELMIAVRLSAQCTDARVNLVTPALFAAYPTLEAMAAAPIEDVENYVRSCGFYKHKAGILCWPARCCSATTAERSPAPWRSCCGCPV